MVVLIIATNKLLEACNRSVQQRQHTSFRCPCIPCRGDVPIAWYALHHTLIGSFYPSATIIDGIQSSIDSLFTITSRRRLGGLLTSRCIGSDKTFGTNITLCRLPKFGTLAGKHCTQNKSSSHCRLVCMRRLDVVFPPTAYHAASQ